MISSIIIGFFAGLLARFFMPGRDPLGFILTILLGIGGAFLAAFLGRQMGYYQPNEPAGFLASILGAMLILFLYRLVAGRKRVP
jgi:uncharacterized membrane protein YeaQ/YmgE (transglycosylase-associated protein family)